MSSPKTENPSALRPALQLDESLLTRHEMVGAGAFANVYRGMYAGKPVAIKELKPGIFELHSQSFLREVELHSRVRSRYIIQFIGFISPPKWEHHAIVFEFMSGGNLAKHLPKIKEHKDRLRVVLAVARAIDALHNQTEPPIVHRDIKCENVLVSHDLSEIKLADLGLSNAKISASAFQTRGVGTPLYMAPELWGNEGHVVSADVYSFAMLVFHVVTGKPPFSEFADYHSLEKLRAAVQNGARPTTTMLHPFFRQLMEKCWKQNAYERPKITGIMHEIQEEYDSFRPWSCNILDAIVTVTDQNKVVVSIPPKAPIEQLSLNLRDFVQRVTDFQTQLLEPLVYGEMVPAEEFWMRIRRCLRAADGCFDETFFIKLQELQTKVICACSSIKSPPSSIQSPPRRLSEWQTSSS